MGLDMYAYSINEDLVKDQPDVDGESLSKLVCKYYGFTVRSEDSANALTSEEYSEYFKARGKVMEKAREEDVFNPDFDYWRKFNALHSWMEKLYYSKGGTATSFNCCDMRLREQDIDALEEARKETVNGSGFGLKPVSGFFFGGETIYPEDLEDLRKFIVKAREAMTNGKAIYYSSWW